MCIPLKSPAGSHTMLLAGRARRDLNQSQRESVVTSLLVYAGKGKQSVASCCFHGGAVPHCGAALTEETNMGIIQESVSSQTGSVKPE